MPSAIVHHSIYARTETLYPSFSVLLVDDEPAWLRSLSISLERSPGITNIPQCQDSWRVADILSAHDDGLVLLDLTMPHLSKGPSLLPSVRSNHGHVAKKPHPSPANPSPSTGKPQLALPLKWE